MHAFPNKTVPSGRKERYSDKCGLVKGLLTFLNQLVLLHSPSIFY